MDESPSISLPTAAASAVNGGPKRHKNKQPLAVLSGTTSFRLLCHASRIGGVIGKSGVTIKQLRQGTSAKIRVEDPIPGSDYRVITVTGNSSVNRTLSFSENDECIEVSVAQEALIRVFEKILVVAAEADGGQFAPEVVVSCRLLTDKSVIGSVIGKAGKVIEKIRKDTGCKIRVIVKDKLPSCALPNDEMIEIQGDMLAMKKALVTVTRCLQDSPNAHKAKMVLSRPHNTVSREPVPNEYMDIPSVSSDGDTCPPFIDSQSSKQEIVFRMLCSNDCVGSVIGRSATILKALKKESGANITVAGPVPECDQRLITISAMESLGSQISPAQNAAILVFNRIVDSNGTHPISATMLVSRNQMGCLLGKGGSIIADMRKVTGAVIKLGGDNQLPKCALENDQLVLMTGEFVNVRDALYSVTGRLRNKFFSNKMSDAKWQSSIGADNSAVKGGVELGSVGRSAVVSNVSVEIIVPENVIGSVYGENGSNLSRLIQISGAKVVVHEPHSGTTDHIVVISGTPDETQSAQSLLQAFILADQ